MDIRASYEKFEDVLEDIFGMVFFVYLSVLYIIINILSQISKYLSLCYKEITVNKLLLLLLLQELENVICSY